MLKEYCKWNKEVFQNEREKYEDKGSIAGFDPNLFDMFLYQ